MENIISHQAMPDMLRRQAVAVCHLSALLQVEGFCSTHQKAVKLVSVAQMFQLGYTNTDIKTCLAKYSQCRLHSLMSLPSQCIKQ